MAAVFEEAGFDAPRPPWPRVPYDEAMARYGIDRPDRRFGLEIEDVSDAVAGSEFQVFAKRAGVRAASCARSTPARTSCRARRSTS